MTMNNITILQSANQYQLTLPNGACVGLLAFPPDHQYIQDFKALEYITKALAIRCGVYERQKKAR